MEDRQGPRMPRPGLATTTWPALAEMARGSRLLAAFLALALLATATRVLPPLAIGLVVDRVGANRAHATLAAIVAGLCVLALVELALAAARDEAGLALRMRGAAAFAGRAADARAGAAATLELVEAATCVPALALVAIGCLSLAGARVAAGAACLVLAHLVAAAVLAAARSEAAWRLHDAPRASQAAAALEMERARAAARRALGAVGRLGHALALGLCALEVIAGALAPGGLIMALLLLRQLQSSAEAASGTWLRGVELVPRLATAARGQAP